MRLEAYDGADAGRFAAGEDPIVRSAGFPCRLSGCERTFQVTDQSSMEALAAASAARTAHETMEHGYHHVRLGDEPHAPYFRSKVKPAEAKPR